MPKNNPYKDDERDSLRDLCKLLKPFGIEYQGQDEDDYGVDFEFELIQEDERTNFRFIVQLKTTRKVSNKRDASVSYPINIDNIKYLSNNEPSLYILHSKRTGNFYYKFTTDICKELSIKNELWRNSTTEITVNFLQIVDSESIKGIFKYVSDLSEKLRNLHSHIEIKDFKPKLDQRLILQSDLSIFSEDKLKAKIENLGDIFINLGASNSLIEIANNIPNSWINSSVSNLYLAIANYNTGNLYYSKALLNKVQVTEIPTHLIEHYHFYELSIKIELGQISKEEFEIGLSNFSKSGDVQFKLRLDKIQLEVLNCDTKEEKLKKLLLFDKIIESESFFLRKNSVITKLILLKGHILHHEIIKTFSNLCISHNIIFSKSNQVAIDKFYDLLAEDFYNYIKFFKEFQEKVDKECDYFHKYLSIYNFCRIHFLIESSRIILDFNLERPVNTPLTSLEISSFKPIIELLDNAIEYFDNVQHINNNLECLLLKCSIYDFISKKNEVETMTNKIYSLVKVIGVEKKRQEIDSFFKVGMIHRPFFEFYAKVQTANQKKLDLHYGSQHFVNELKKIEKIEEQEAGRNPFIKGAYIFELFPLGFFQIPLDKINTFFDIMSITDVNLKNKLQFSNEKFQLINISAVNINGSSNDETDWIKISLESQEITLRRRIELYKNKFHKLRGIFRS